MAVYNARNSSSLFVDRDDAAWMCELMKNTWRKNNSFLGVFMSCDLSADSGCGSTVAVYVYIIMVL